MPRGFSRLNNEQIAKEAFSVLIEGEKPARNFPKRTLRDRLGDPDIYPTFLKLCVELDEGKKNIYLKKGLFFVIQSIGVSVIAKRAKLNRQTIYRMLSPSGNPTLQNFTQLLRGVNMRLWVVEEEFAWAGDEFYRPRSQPKDIDLEQAQMSSGNRRVRPSKNRHGNRRDQLK